MSEILLFKTNPPKHKGNNGDIAVASDEKGNINLYAKYHNNWYQTSILKRSIPNIKRKSQIKRLILQDNLHVNGRAIVGRDKIKSQSEGIRHGRDNYLNIGSEAFDVQTSTTVSKISIGDIDLQGSWGSTGAIISITGADNNSSRHLYISGGDSSSGNTNGGNVYIDAGLKAGSGTTGTISIGHNGSNVRSSATNLYSSGAITLDAEGDIEINANGGDIVFKDDSASLGTINGDGLTINNIGTDSAGDNYLVEVSGLVKKRTPAEVRADIGAGTSSVAALNDLSDVTYSSGDLTISSLDKVISGDLSFESSGAILIDKNSTATSSSSTKALTIDFDHTGISASGQAIFNYGLDIDMNCDSVTHVGSVANTGIDIDLVALTDGNQYNTGININCSGGDTNTGVYIATAGTHIKLAALADPLTDYATFSVADTGDLTIATEGDGSTDSDLILDADGDLILDAATGRTRFYIAGDTDDYCSLTVAANGATTIATADSDGSVGTLTLAPNGNILLTPSGGSMRFYDSDNSFDYVDFDVDVNGGLTIETTDNGGANANMTLDPDGDLIVSGADLKIDAAKSLYLDGGGDTYIAEVAADIVRHYVGGDIMMMLKEDGDDGNTITFSSASVGFIQQEPTYDSGTTVVDFRFSNKQNLTFGAGNITHLQLIFPEVSGNFQLLIKQDGTGSRTITGAYKCYEYDESVASGGGGIVVFAGGSNPTLTTDANHVDIISIYWDDDNQTAYGVASLDFQF